MQLTSHGLVKSRTRSIAALLGAVATLLVVGFVPAAANAEIEPSTVSFPGSPLTVSVGSQGQCQSNYSNNGNNYFPGGGNFGDCGFFLAFPSEGAGKAGAGQPAALKEQTIGFFGIAGPGLTDSYTPVSQSSVTGSGSATDPYTQTTAFKVVDSAEKEDAQVTETTTYVNGQPQFTSTYNVKNVTSSPATTIYFRAIYAGDLYVNGNDFGTGVFLAGPPRFIGGQNTSSGVLGGFQEAPAPALPWSSFQEGCWNEALVESISGAKCDGASVTDQGIWADVRNTDEEPRAFNETIDPAPIDNGAGVEWDQLREKGLEPGKEQAFTIVNRTQVPNTLQVSPASQTLTQGQTETISVTAVDTADQPYAGKTVHYTVAGANPQSGTVVLNAAGQAQISYVGHNAGIDTTQLFVDLGGSGSQTTNDPAGTARVTFLPLPPTPNSTYKVQSIKANSDGTVTIVFVPTQSGTATLEVTVPTGTISRHAALEARRARRCGRGQVRIRGRCRPKTTVSGVVSATGVAGVPLTLTVKPAPKVSSALKKGKNVKLTATLIYRSALGGAPTVQVFHVTVKGKRHHRKRH